MDRIELATVKSLLHLLNIDQVGYPKLEIVHLHNVGAIMKMNFSLLTPDSCS